MKQFVFWALLVGSAFVESRDARLSAQQADSTSLFILKLDSKVVSYNASNNTLRSLRYDDVEEYGVRSVLVTKSGLTGAIDYDGSEIIPPVHKVVAASADGAWFAVCSTNGQWSLQSRDGVLVNGRWEWISAPDDGHAVVQDAKGYGILSLSAGSTRHVPALELRDIRHGAISAKEGKKRWNYYDARGNPILESGATFVEPASEGYGAAQFENGASVHWKVYNISDGVEVFPGRKFEDVSKVCDGVFFASESGKVFLCDISQKSVIPMDVDEVRPGRTLYPAKKGGAMGLYQSERGVGNPSGI